jgi:hypothetical protein
MGAIAPRNDVGVDCGGGAGAIGSETVERAEGLLRAGVVVSAPPGEHAIATVASTTTDATKDFMPSFLGPILVERRDRNGGVPAALLSSAIQSILVKDATVRLTLDSPLVLPGAHRWPRSPPPC